MGAPPLEPDRHQIELFTAALFCHAGKAGYASVRAFYEDDSSKPFRITPAAMAGGLSFLNETAVDDARRAAQHPQKVVFCPPLAVFSNGKRAREIDIAEGLALSVECDKQPQQALAKLESIIGPTTVVVRSGGVWTDANGGTHDKLHLHWRLNTPARSKDALAKLKQARDIAARLVGGDPSNKSVAHPIRWPGSWHRKATPTLCSIATADQRQEIDLDIALAALIAAAPKADAFSDSAAGNGQDKVPPSEWAELIADILTAKDYHTAIAKLAMKLLRSGTDDGATVNLIRAWMDSSTGPRDSRWQARYDDIPRAVSTAREKIVPPHDDNQDDKQKLAFIDMSNWDNEPRPERQWAIQDRVPLNQVGLFSGEGGAGKSILEMMKDVAHVTAKDWLGSLPVPGPTIYFGAEDDENETHIRFYDIAQHYGVTFKELIAGGLHVVCKLGQDATLCAIARSGKVETTALYKQLYEQAGDIKPKNISIDTLSRVFAGSELDRGQVYAFAMHMQALAMVASGSVTVLSHPSLQGISSGSGISGSTAWHGAFRFRQYLTSVKPEGDEEPDNDLRQIEFKKNQYGPRGEAIVLRYQRGLFLPVAGTGTLEKLAAEQHADSLFLELLDTFTQQGRNVSHFKNVTNYAPIVFAKDPKAKAIPKITKALADTMERLFAAKKIKVETYGRPSRPNTRIVRHDG